MVYDLSEDGQKSIENENIFDIVINDEVVDSKVNPAKNSGFYGLEKKRFVIEVREQHSIIIKFVSFSGKSFINAIKIRKI